MDKLFKELVDLPGAPGYEHEVRAFMKKNLEPYVDEIIQDKLGSVFGVINKGHSGLKIMIAGHMDEVGAVVSGITPNGMIKMKSLGGVLGATYVSQILNVYTDDNVISGITASVPPHLARGSKNASSASSFDDLLLDIGADDDKHAKELGVKIGQQIVSENHYRETIDQKKIISKAWDDRFGCGMALELAKSIKKEELNCELYVGATVQEEVGLRGAGTAAYMVDPDIFITIDCSPVNDAFDPSTTNGKLGDGFLLRYYDPSCIMHQGMKKYFETTAKTHNIKHQYYASKGGTDAAKVQLIRDGIIVATLGMPARYIHSTASMIHKDDYEAVKKMLFTIVKDFDDKRLEEIKNNV